MLVAEIISVIWCTLGLILNLITLYITGIRLNFNGIDLKLMSLVSVLDSIMSLHHILRIILIWANVLEPLKPATNWCVWDSTILFTLAQTAMETVAILGVMRYLAICYDKHYKNLIWILVIMLLFLTSLAMSTGNSMFSHAYAWSKSGLLCLPFTLKKAPNYTYFTTWLIILSSRFVISLIIITFCYYKVTLAYHKILKNNLYEQAITVELETVVCSENNKISKDYSFSNLVIPPALKQQAVRQRFKITFQLLSIAFLYIICICPDIIIAIGFTLNHTSVTAKVMAASHILFVTTSIINPLFVLISHEPSRRQLVKLGQSLLGITPSEPDGIFPYQQY